MIYVSCQYLLHLQIRFPHSTHVFDVRARVDRDDITVLDAQVVADNPVEASTAIVEVIIRQHDQDGVLPLLASNQDGIATEELQSLHRVVRQGNDRVVIVDGVGNPATV